MTNLMIFKGFLACALKTNLKKREGHLFIPNLLERINEEQGKLIKSATAYKQEKFLLLCELS